MGLSYARQQRVGRAFVFLADCARCSWHMWHPETGKRRTLVPLCQLLHICSSCAAIEPNTRLDHKFLRAVEEELEDGLWSLNPFDSGRELDIFPPSLWAEVRTLAARERDADSPVFVIQKKSGTW